MKRIHKIAALSMALLILVNSVGLAVFDHTCNFSQSTTRSLFQEDSCCKTEKSKSKGSKEGLRFEKEACCSTESSFYVAKVFPASENDISLSIGTTIAPFQAFKPAFIALGSECVALLFSDCSGPPLSVRSSLYSLFEVFII